MNHPVELLAQSYLKDIISNKKKMDSDIIETVVNDIRDALHRQFAGESRQEFRLRPSNLGRPKCQLWFDKNKPSEPAELPSNFVINMFLGDVVEAVFKGLLRAMKVEFEDNGKIDIDIDGQNITGEYDLILNGKVDDVKSASPWSYKHKFSNYGELKTKDSFGYIPQLAIYAEATGADVGGWWVINKANGEFKYVPADEMDRKEVIGEVKKTISYINNDEPFERCFEPVPETYRGKPSGNMKLSKECGFCRYKHDCWDNIQELPSKVSQAKEKPMEEYVHLA
jgi:CRISPR/Cas system-associated exonuclease Cas4 (RecB family)